MKDRQSELTGRQDEISIKGHKELFTKYFLCSNRFIFLILLVSDAELNFGPCQTRDRKTLQGSLKKISKAKM